MNLVCLRQIILLATICWSLAGCSGDSAFNGRDKSRANSFQAKATEPPKEDTERSEVFQLPKQDADPEQDIFVGEASGKPTHPYQKTSDLPADIAGGWLTMPGSITAIGKEAYDVKAIDSKVDFFRILLPEPYASMTTLPERLALFYKSRENENQVSFGFVSGSRLTREGGEVVFPIIRTARYQFGLLPKDVDSGPDRKITLPAAEVSLTPGESDRELVAHIYPRDSFAVMESVQIFDVTAAQNFVCPKTDNVSNSTTAILISSLNFAADRAEWEELASQNHSRQIAFAVPRDSRTHVQFCFYNKLGDNLHDDSFAVSALSATADRNIFGRFGNPDNEGGLVGQLFATDNTLKELPEFLDLEPLGTLAMADLNVPNTRFSTGFSEYPTLISWFALDITGYITIPRDCHCEFRLVSDDAAKLFIDDQLIINNNRIQVATGVTAQVPLSPGAHKIRIQYLQGRPDRVALQLFWKVKSPNDLFEIVPYTAFHH